jgi:NtrC-family two-component system sensor histidine kinase KinB
MQAVRHEATRLRDLNQETMYAASRRAESLAERVVASAGLLGLAAIGFGLVLSLLLSRHLTRPVDRLRQAAGRVATGDYDVAVDITRNDELGFLALQFNDMVERLRLYRDLNLERLLAEKVKTEAILREMSDGLLMVDLDGRLLHVNPAAARALGGRTDALVGRPAEDALPEGGLRDALARALADADAPLETGVLERKGGEEPRAYQYALTRVAAGPGAPVGVLAILRDVTEMRELDRLKSEFVATASHELRTPITTIGMSLALLGERIGATLDPRIAGLLDAARQDAGRLERLVGDLLDLSKVQAGGVEPERRPIDVVELLHEVERSFEAQAADRGIDLAMDEIAGDLPNAFADAEQIRRAVANLVANAIRYTPRNGRIRLDARRVERGVRIEVRDTGPGIQASQRKRIFEKFARADVPGAAGGTGLGLALAREIVIAHGGEIDVEPNAGGGSVFFVVLPAVRHAAPAPR